MVRKDFAEKLMVKPFGENSGPEDKWPPGRRREACKTRSQESGLGERITGIPGAFPSFV